MYRINYILFLLIFIIQPSLAGSLNNIEHAKKAKLMHVKKKDIASANLLRKKAFLKESKTRIKLALPLLIAGLAELYLNVSFNNNITSKIKSCGEQEIDVNKFLNCEQASDMSSRNNETNIILSFLPLYLLIDIVLSSSFIVNKTLYNYIARPILLISDHYFNGLLYLCLFLRSNIVSDYVPLSNYISLYAIISGFSNLWYRAVERADSDKKIEDFQSNINNDSSQTSIDIYLVDQ